MFRVSLREIHRKTEVVLPSKLEWHPVERIPPPRLLIPKTVTVEQILCITRPVSAVSLGRP